LLAESPLVIQAQAHDVSRMMNEAAMRAHPRRFGKRISDFLGKNDL
jgi:hypothetical protein